MTARDSQLTGRLRLRHLMEETEAAGEAMADVRPRFECLASDSSAPRAVSAFNLFQTPEPLADRMASLLRPGRVLEPSAGLGRLYRAVRYRTDSPVVLVEIAPQCCAELYRATAGDDVARLIQGDFLEQTPEALGLFASVLMNPPFKMGRDVKHIAHARRFLAPGGRLVALCMNGPKQRAALRPMAEDSGGWWEELPDGTFKSEGTRVDTALLCIDA